MNREKLKVPLCENGIISYAERPKSHCYFRYIFIGCLLFILVVSLFVNVMYTMTRVENLEEEVEMLKKALVKIRILDEDIIRFASEDNLYEDEDTGEPDIFLSKTDNENEYSEYDVYDQNENTTEMDDTVDTNNDQYKSAADLTKDVKDETVTRNRRNVIGATDDGVLVNAESYAEKKRQNNTARIHSQLVSITAIPAQPSSFGSPYHTDSYENTRKMHPTKAPPLVYTRQSRTMHFDDKSKAFRRVVKKSSLLKSGGTVSESMEETSTQYPDFTIVRDDFRRRYKQKHLNLEVLDGRHPRVGRIKPLPSIHYGGDTSSYIQGRHSNFNGNGHLKHNQRKFSDWKVSDWVESTGMTSHFGVHDGVLTIKETGLYYIYSQVYYLDPHDVNGYMVLRNQDPILQCTVSITTQGLLKGNTCFTAGVSHLSEGDKIAIMDFFDGRYTLFEAGKSFYGVIKLGDVKINNN